MWVANHYLMMEWWTLDPSLAQRWDPCRECPKIWQDALHCLVIWICISTPFSETAAPVAMLLPLQTGASKSYLIRNTHMSSASSASFSVLPPNSSAMRPHSSSSSSSLLLLIPPNSLISRVSHCDIVLRCITHQWMVYELHPRAISENWLIIDWSTASLS